MWGARDGEHRCVCECMLGSDQMEQLCYRDGLVTGKPKPSGKWLVKHNKGENAE